MCVCVCVCVCARLCVIDIQLLENVIRSITVPTFCQDPLCQLVSVRTQYHHVGRVNKEKY